MLVFEGGGSLWGGKPENPEKNPQSRDENQQQTQFTYDAGSGNRTRDTLVVGERSNNCATTAPPLLAKTVYFAKITFCPGKGRGGRAPPFFLDFKNVFGTLTLLYFASRIRPQFCMLHVLKSEVFIRGIRGKGGIRPPFTEFSESAPDLGTVNS